MPKVVRSLKLKVESTLNFLLFAFTKAVDGLGKSSVMFGKKMAFRHSVVFTNYLAVFKKPFYAQFVNALYAAFNTVRASIFNLLIKPFSTLSTPAITITMNINNLLMEIV